MLISCEDSTIQAGSRLFFEGLRWKIKANQNWAIIGPNGAGKSVLVQAICRKLPIPRGQILYFFDHVHFPEGRTYLNPDEVLIFSAETHQNLLRRYAEYYQARWQSFEGEDAPTVRGLLAAHSSLPFSAPFQNISLDPQKLEEVSARMGLDALLDRKVLLLSAGESRKVMIARLLLRSLRLLILDDPFVGLDAQAREQLRKTIGEILRMGNPKILLVCSHLEDLPDGISHIIHVEEGQVIAKGKRSRMTFSLPRRMLEPPGFQERTVFEAMVAKYSQNLKENGLCLLPAFIEMQDVTISYTGIDVLKNVSWKVRPGERWALLGENGAGKTTLLSLVLADNPQSYRNAISLFGKPRGSGESIWEIKRNIGWVSPELQIYYPHTATCLEVACSGFFDSVGLYQRCSVQQTASAAGWLIAFGLEHLAKAAFRTLSSGQQRLVLLARSLVKNPPILVLDEPCQSLDDHHRHLIVELIDQICAHTPLTLVYVTHYQDEIPGSITHQMVLKQGVVTYQGKIK
jgi:molybdate transport system ATP-binding protein